MGFTFFITVFIIHALTHLSRSHRLLPSCSTVAPAHFYALGMLDGDADFRIYFTPSSVPVTLA